jgi:hypothetical protein
MTSEERAVIDLAVNRHYLLYYGHIQAAEWAERDLTKAVARLIESRNQWMKPGKRFFTIEDGKSLDVPTNVIKLDVEGRAILVADASTLEEIAKALRAVERMS